MANRMVVVLDTREGRKLVRKTPRNQREEHLTYFSRCGEVEVLCSEEESEGFEQETGTKLDSDTLNDKTFTALCTYLNENAGLKLFNVF